MPPQESKVLHGGDGGPSQGDAIADSTDILTNEEAFKKFQEVQGQLTDRSRDYWRWWRTIPADLKSNQNFLTLQSQLEGTENRIAIARRQLTTRRRKHATTPSSEQMSGLWVGAAVLYPDAQPMQYFTVAEETTKAPEVKF